MAPHDAGTPGAGGDPPPMPPGGGLSLQPRWLWISFVVLALAIPLLGFLYEKMR